MINLSQHLGNEATVELHKWESHLYFSLKATAFEGTWKCGDTSLHQIQLVLSLCMFHFLGFNQPQMENVWEKIIVFMSNMYRFFWGGPYSSNNIYNNYLHSTYSMGGVVSHLGMTSSIWEGMHRLYANSTLFYTRDLGICWVWFSQRVWEPIPHGNREATVVLSHFIHTAKLFYVLFPHIKSLATKI